MRAQGAAPGAGTSGQRLIDKGRQKNSAHNAQTQGGAAMSAATGKKRGRPPKVRPAYGDAVIPGMSQRDVAAAIGVTTRELRRWRVFADAPKELVNEYLNRPGVPNSSELELLIRRRTGKSTDRVRRCPRCGYALRIVDAT